MQSNQVSKWNSVYHEFIYPVGNIIYQRHPLLSLCYHWYPKAGIQYISVLTYCPLVNGSLMLVDICDRRGICLDEPITPYRATETLAAVELLCSIPV